MGTLFESFNSNELIASSVYGLSYLNNLWLGWEYDTNLSNCFRSTESVLFKATTEEPCYGDDDAWMSFGCGVLLGLINPFAGIAYGTIDTYIATHSEPCSD